MRSRWGTREAAAVIVVLTLVAPASIWAQPQRPSTTDAGTDNVIRLTPDELTWTAGPPMLPPGARMAVIEGSFARPGPFTVRLKFPANYRIPPPLASRQGDGDRHLR